MRPLLCRNGLDFLHATSDDNKIAVGDFSSDCRSATDILIPLVLTGLGLGMTSLSPGLLACALTASIAFPFVPDVVKASVFNVLQIA